MADWHTRERTSATVSVCDQKKDGRSQGTAPSSSVPWTRQDRAARAPRHEISALLTVLRGSGPAGTGLETRGGLAAEIMISEAARSDHTRPGSPGTASREISSVLAVTQLLRLTRTSGEGTGGQPGKDVAATSFRLFHRKSCSGGVSSGGPPSKWQRHYADFTNELLLRVDIDFADGLNASARR